MKRFFMDFMQGRYGADSLSKCLIGIGIASMVLNLLLGSRLLYTMTLILLGIVYFRMFSRNIYKRSAENQKYLEMTRGIRTRLNKFSRRVSQSRYYHIYKCPSCGQKIRIPRGKGRICITCPKCHHEFEKKS